MPRKYKGRSRRPRVYGRKRFGGKRILYNRSKTGVIKITRKMPEVVIKSTSLAGIVNTVDPSNITVVSTGTPVLSVGSANSYDIPFSMTFRLNQLINHTDVTGLCDKYKIVSAYTRLYYNKSQAQAGAAAGMPYLEFITDHDDSGLPSVSSLREKMGVKLKTFKNASSYIGMKVLPKPARELYRSAISTAYEVPTKAPWINSSYSDVDHHGIKGVIHNVYLGANTDGLECFKFDVSLSVIGKDFQ